jgi:DNA-directed RNA polymerase specialized sigma subunit
MRDNRITRGEIHPRNRKIVEKLYTKHNKWVSIVRNLNKDYEFAEDVVSDFYEQMLYYATPKMIKDNGEVNEGYAYISLRNTLYKTLKEDNKLPTTRLEDKHLNIAVDTDEDRLAYDKVCQLIEEETSTWDWHEQQLFDMYFTSGKSLRQLGNEIDTSWTSIYYVIKNSKDKIRDVLLEDYKDYLNGDYDLIKDI